jgi:hypothetical protein
MQTNQKADLIGDRDRILFAESSHLSASFRQGLKDPMEEIVQVDPEMDPKPNSSLPHRRQSSYLGVSQDLGSGRWEAYTYAARRKM